jgi:16S rRNA (cytidine1402-2'-O)-methyltransferase
MGTLHVVATPIGNLEDISHRALRILAEVDALACEDTRMTRRILDRYEIDRPRISFSYHEHNEERAGVRILGLLDEGIDVALCSDGGCPGVSDPGYRIIRDCYEAGHDVDVLPGPTAVTTALLASGLSTSSFTFKGFPPRKSGPRKRFLEEDGDTPHTLIIYESPFRIGKLLADAFEVLGDRQAAVCIELTKKFERVERGYLADLADLFHERKVKGEVCLVVAGNNPKFHRDAADEGGAARQID